MKTNHYRRLIALGMIVVVVVACGGPAATTEPQPVEEQAVPGAQEAPAAGDEAQQPAEASSSTNAVYRTGQGQVTSASVGRLIIKDGQLTLLVRDTDVTIGGVMQIVGDLGGYVVSSRVWFEAHGATNYKYATLTLGVPSTDFERAIDRLRSLALRVLDEVSSGEDVTDEYVDLQSRLESLEATRSRILTFLEDAKSVEEALKVNKELASVEADMEEVQGRMNYLSGRSAFSTITVTIEPELPELTPFPTPTPVPWHADRTFTNARRSLADAYRGIADLAIWLVVAVVPVLAPFVLIGWVIWRAMRRKKAAPSKDTPPHET